MKGGMSKDTPLPKDWREGRRLRAWELYQQGWKQKDIAAALGVSEGAVSQWITKGRAQGPEALRHHPSPGAPPKLRPEQLAHLPLLLAKGAEAFGFRGAVWTAARVAVVIKQEYGVSYHPTHCSRLLCKIKYSCQKPVERASQRDEAAIKLWRDQRSVELKKRPKRKSAPSSL
jgi:transposase